MANAAQTRTLIGRDAELERVEEFLGAIGSGPAALLLEGEAGIGKTTLWSQGLVSSAARRATRPALPPGRARDATGLRRARRPARRGARDRPWPTCPRRSGARSRWRCCAPSPRGSSRSSAPSASACSGCCARWRPTRRRCSRSTTPSGSTAVRERARVRGAAPRRTSASASSASAGAAARTSRSGSTAPCPLPASKRLALTTSTPASSSCCCASSSGCRSRGAPSSACAAQPAATSSSRSRSAGRWPSAASPWTPRRSCPIPANLLELVRDRLELLPPGARAAALVASALSRPTVAGRRRRARGARRAAGRGRGRRGGRPRARRRAPRIRAPAARDGRLPAALARPSGASLHAGLAEVLDDPEERARHLALAADEPDEAVASALDEAAPGALRRAARRTPPPTCWSRLAG